MKNRDYGAVRDTLTRKYQAITERLAEMNRDGHVDPPLPENPDRTVRRPRADLVAELASIVAAKKAFSASCRPQLRGRR